MSDVIWMIMSDGKWHQRKGNISIQLELMLFSFPFFYFEFVQLKVHLEIRLYFGGVI